MVTEDCAKAVPEMAANVARAIRDFFIASFSKVKQGPESGGRTSPFETLSQPPHQEVVCIPPDDCVFAKTFDQELFFSLQACNTAPCLPSFLSCKFHFYQSRQALSASFETNLSPVINSTTQSHSRAMSTFSPRRNRLFTLEE
jgi:hypothetical protein